MSLEIDFEITQKDNCTQLQLCDTTCEFDPRGLVNCCNGYGDGSNPTKRDIAFTRFNFELPNGQSFLDIDKQWVPGTKSQAEFRINVGTNGVIVVSVNGIILGNVVFMTNIPFTVNLLIQNINSTSSTTGFNAYLKPGTVDSIIVERNETGVSYNGSVINIGLSGDVEVILDSPTFNGGSDETDCTCFVLPDLYGELDCPISYNWEDGVYTITYILYDFNNQEIARKSLKVLLDCNSQIGIRDIILASSKGACGCSDDVNEKILKIKLMLEMAHVQMEECLYEAANDTIKLVCKMIKNICLDC